MDNLGDNHRATVVKEIAHIHFTALIYLTLSGDRIESIEGLPRVKMTSIKYLILRRYADNIGDNNITSVGVIRKASWPALVQLDISTE